MFACRRGARRVCSILGTGIDRFGGMLHPPRSARRAGCRGIPGRVPEEGADCAGRPSRRRLTSGQKKRRRARAVSSGMKAVSSLPQEGAARSGALFLSFFGPSFVLRPRAFPRGRPPPRLEDLYPTTGSPRRGFPRCTRYHPGPGAMFRLLRSGSSPPPVRILRCRVPAKGCPRNRWCGGRPGERAAAGRGVANEPGDAVAPEDAERDPRAAPEGGRVRGR